MVLEGLDEAARCGQGWQGGGGKCSLFGCSLGCRSILDSLLIWNITTGTDNSDFSSPNLSHSSEDRTAGNCSVIPVACHKIYVFANCDAAIMNRERSVGTSKFLLHGGVPGIGEGFVRGDVGHKLHDLLV
jgi:hypothetical protein